MPTQEEMERMITPEEFYKKIVIKSEDGTEKPFELTELQKKIALEFEKKLNEGKGLATRQVKGRMEDIPIQGTVIDCPENKVVVNVPIYFSPVGFICGECDYIMATDGFPKEGKVKAFCTNLYCSQNLITKVITLPFSESCVVSPSDA